MCGIAGLILKNGNSSILKNTLASMIRQLAHRGPDGEGLWLHDNIGIAHRRLSIIDLEGGKQPLCNEDETVWITFNGEIYNFKDLQQMLRQKGHAFKTNSDTEVIVHAYEEWGVDCVKQFRGMFAFAIVDKNKNEIFLARDHFGIKPLLYYQDENTFAFASELQAIKNVQGFNMELDNASIDQYLTFKYINAPNSIYTRVKKLQPAHFMRIGFDGQIKELEQYWKLSFTPDYSLSENDWLDRLDAAMRESVRAHLTADVPFGAFLSGGIDSSLVVGYMAQGMNQPVKTFSIGFEDAGFNEIPYAREVANKWQTQHFESIVKQDALAILPDLVKHYGEPFGDVSAIPTYYLSKMTRGQVTMAFSGDAGDELFAGYESYTHLWAKQSSPIPYHLSAFKKKLYPFVNAVNKTKYPYRKAEFPDWLRVNTGNLLTVNQLWKSDYALQIGEGYFGEISSDFDQAQQYKHFQQAQWMDFKSYLPGDILTKVDIASMMSSLEVRTPILDMKIVELASTIPQEMNIRMVNGKYEGKILLKKLLRKHFPIDFVYRPKQGFAVPLDKWMDGISKESQEVYDRLLAKGSCISELFEHHEIKMVLKSKRKEMIWKLLFLEEWLYQNQ